MQLNKPVLLITSSPSLVKLYLNKNWPDLKFKFVDTQDQEFETLISLSKSKNLFGQQNFYLIVKNFFNLKKEFSWPSFFVIWEEKLPTTKIFNFVQRQFQFSIINLEEQKEVLLEEFIKKIGLQINKDILKKLEETFFQDQEGFEALFNELNKLQVYSSKITSEVIEKLFYYPFWIKSVPIWENLSFSIAGNFFSKNKKGFLTLAKKSLKQNVPLEVILGEIHFILKKITLKKIFGIGFLSRDYFHFLKLWSYQELKNLANFLAESDIKYKRHQISPQEIIEKLTQNFL